jgi:hypothetical protein
MIGAALAPMDQKPLALADRLYGKPIQAIDIDDERPSVPVFIMPEDTHIAIK